MSRVVFDQSQWPLLRVAVTGRPSPAEADALFADLRAYFERGEQIALIVDSRQAERGDGALRARVLEHLKALKPLFEQYCVGQCFIVDNLLMRMFLRGVIMASRMPHPQSVRATEDEAEAWCRVKLGGQGGDEH